MIKIDITKIKDIEKLKQKVKIFTDYLNKYPEEFLQALGQVLYETDDTLDINEISYIIDNLLEVTCDQKELNEKTIKDTIEKFMKQFQPVIEAANKICERFKELTK